MLYNTFKPKRAHIFCASFFHLTKGTIAMENIREMSISSTLKEYLEVIYDISKTGSGARTTDIAKRLGISKPSVNRAVGTLKAKGYVTHEPYGAVLLTDKGRELGEYSGNRNRMVKRFLINVLKMNDADAEKEAVQIARSISFVTAEKMRSYMEA